MSYNKYLINENQQSNIPGFVFNQPPPPVKLNDDEIIKKFDAIIKSRKRPNKHKTKLQIHGITNKIKEIYCQLDTMKMFEKELSDNLHLNEIQWNSRLQQLELLKNNVQIAMDEFTPDLMKSLKVAVMKRNSKRMRLCKVKDRQKQQLKRRENLSKIIDENLQKIQLELKQKEQQKQDKLETDRILSSVTHKKQDARRMLDLLDNLTKLRKAREKTAIGQGQAVSTNGHFYQNVEKLQRMWHSCMQSYQEEEEILKKKLSEHRDRKNNFDELCMVMFGTESLPQRNFEGDLEEFLRVRSSWDEHLAEDGSSLPVGWILPQSFYNQTS